jgi:hypothetical protein
LVNISGSVDSSAGLKPSGAKRYISGVEYNLLGEARVM